MSADGNLTIWMRLRNAREVINGLRQTATQTSLLGRSVDRLASQMDRASRRGFLMNQAVFTLRRYSYMATLAVTAGAAAILKWGYDYNKQVQNARVAFGLFLPTQQAVTDEIKTLYRVAAVTPFLFTDITTTARRFMAFGLNVKDTNRTIVNITDSLSALGLVSGASLNRASLALGHMLSLGRLTGQTVYQLARDNIPIIQALEKELGLTGDQLRHVGTLGISASTALEALNKYIEQSPQHGAGRRFGLGTVQGILSTLRDYTAQYMGEIEHRQFVGLQRMGTRFLNFMQGAGARGAANGGGIAGFIGAWNPALGGAVHQLFNDVSALWRIFKDGLIPTFIQVLHVVGPPLYLLFFAMSQALQILSHHTWVLKAFFALLALELAASAGKFLLLLPLQIAYNVAATSGAAILRILSILGLIRITELEGEAAATKTATAADVTRKIELTALGRVLKLNVFWTALSTRGMRLWMAASKGMVVGAGGQFVKLTKLEKAIMAARRAMIAFGLATLGAARAMVIFLFTNPIGWAILLIGALTILYFKWKAFHDIVNKIFFLIKDNWKPISIALGLAFAPIFAAYEAIKHIRDIWRGLRGFVSGIFGGTSSGKANTLPSFGRTLQGGPFQPLFPAKKPEPFVKRPSSQVSKIGQVETGFQNHLQGGIEFNNKTILEVDGKQMAEVVAKHRLDARARR